MPEKLLEKLKEFWGKVVAWWENFTSKQKTIIVVIAGAVLIAFVGLYMILTSPNYTLLEQCESTKEASEIIEILEGEDIKYKVSDDGLRIQVPKASLSTARVTLGASGITTTTYSLDAALEGSFTTTEADKQKKYILYLEDTLETDLLGYFNAIKSARVKIYMPENDGTLLAAKEEASAAIALEIEGDFTDDNANFIAKLVAAALGMKNTDNIVIMDMDANLLFSGDDDATISGNASSQLEVKEQAETLMNNDVKKVLSGTGMFGDIRVSTNLDIDFSTTEKTKHDYTPADGQSQGLLSEESNYTSESSGGSGGVPGTDSNTETTYQYQDNSYNSSTIEEYYRKYVPNEYIEYTTIPPGTINYMNSSVGVSSIDYIVVSEDDVKAQGLLDGITWEEYQQANSEKRQLEVSAEMITLVSNATGIPEEKINIVAYEENVFLDSEGLGVDVSDVIMVIIIILILGLLAVVVIRSMRSEKTEEAPEELSVESLLQSNPEPQLDDIELEQISETRKMIEKFVDENPEAVANLLRNWLNEEWG